MVKILVVGDVMLDEYIEGSTNRVSPEAPVPVVKQTNRFSRLGGAANVALNVIGAGADCALLGLVGYDEYGKLTSELLNKSGVTDLLVHSEKGTIVKSRIVSRGQQIARIDMESRFCSSDVERITSRFFEIVNDYDAVIFSDYDKGTLGSIDQLLYASQKYNIPTFVDPKLNDFLKYKNATVLTPNLSELEGSIHYSNAHSLDENIKEILYLGICEYLLVTLSSEGVKYATSATEVKSVETKKVDVNDVTGAGDTFIAYCAVSYLKMNNMHAAICKAVSAATFAVTKSGTYAVSEADLRCDRDLNFVNSSDYIQLSGIIDSFRVNEKVIGFTNGCFDVLHIGHIDYLNKAKNMCDFLVVGLNSDPSIRTLKGNDRPFNPKKERATNLLSLRAVDLVVEFDDETPLDLIKLVSPDVLIKGSDYKKEDIVGKTYVESYGGKVVTVDFKYNLSTTKLLKILTDA